MGSGVECFIRAVIGAGPAVGTAVAVAVVVVVVVLAVVVVAVSRTPPLPRPSNSVKKSSGRLQDPPGPNLTRPSTTAVYKP